MSEKEKNKILKMASDACIKAFSRAFELGKVVEKNKLKPLVLPYSNSDYLLKLAKYLKKI